MFPSEITAILQDLGYLALIIITPATLYNTVQNLKNGIVLSNHLALDEIRFSEVNKHIGKHDSQIFDLQMDMAAKNGKLNP